MTFNQTIIDDVTLHNTVSVDPKISRILLIESDFYLSSSFQRGLVEQGYNVAHVRYSDLLDPKLKSNIIGYKPDVVILDSSYSNQPTLKVIRGLRNFFDNCLVVLSSNSSEHEEVEAFQLGADEYLIKSVSSKILTVRITALLRRKKHSHKQLHVDDISLADLCLIPRSQKCLVDNKPIKLTGFEFSLLKLLLLNQGAILSRDAIYAELLGRVYNGSERTVDVRVSQLREKLLSANMKKCQIETVWGKGYMLSLVAA
ncbi:response regulator transcription factor [Colwellia sp. D2M02]|uniref:response regulator transcription factor n=1 Tax=Colwellia sp. D2M02 TaxID=2841562 RepID=UPI001C08AAE8|nr:response regulator transcription factor [Colwellia sp. D2M02]MBU2894268.1 response regulator transcription factor [Colwellia sp. D2M02]